MADAKDIIYAVRARLSLPSQADSTFLERLHQAIDLTVNGGLSKLARVVSESENYVDLQKQINVTLVSSAAGRAEGSVTDASLMLDSLRERGLLIHSGARAIPVYSMEDLEYPHADNSTARFFVAGQKVYLSGSSALVPVGNVNVLLISNYVPTVIELPDKLVPELVDIVAGLVASSGQFEGVTFRVKEDIKDA